jgi:hypothetical protein
MADTASASTDPNVITETPLPADDGFKPVTSQQQFDRMVQERIARERAKYADYEELKKAAARLAEIEEANASELEKAQKAAAEAQALLEKTQAEARETRLRAAIIAEAAKPDRKVVDPEAVVALLDRSSLELDDDGTPTNIAQAMDSLLEARPYLVAKDGGTRGSADQGARRGGANQITEAELKTMKPEEIEKARKEGRLDHLLGVR